MKKIAQLVLKYLAKAVLWRHRPFIVGVTGSVGKTMAKDAIYHVLYGKISVRKSVKNYNNEIGVPITILGVGAPGLSPIAWAWICVKWCFIMLQARYPKILILEMGVDRPGDMAYLTSIVKLNIAVVTSVTSSHLEYFSSVEAIAQEKGIIVESLKEDGLVVLNADDPLTWGMRKRTNNSVVTYGFQKRADIRAFNATLAQNKGKVGGLNLKVDYRGKIIPFRLKRLLGRHQAYGALVAFAVADQVKLNLLEVARAIENYSLAPGRLQPVKGRNGTWILDDTYNASAPLGALAALETLKNFTVGRKIAVLGDMLELGIDEESGHRSLASAVITCDPALVVLVGRRMRYLESELFMRGFDREKVTHVESPMEASQILSEYARAGDIILVKGSQGMRMEKIVEVLADPSIEISKRLCRQERKWKKKEFVAP